MGMTGDGVYGHCSVPKKLDNHYDKEGFAMWDKMHKAATKDTKMRNPKEHHNKELGLFTWLNVITLLISKCNKFINWGRGWDEFFSNCNRMISEGYDTKYLAPKFFSDTKFANWVVVLYRDFHRVYPALLVTLEEAKERLSEGTEKEREQAIDVDKLQEGIFNLTFALSLSLLIDIYNIYSQIVKLLQVIDILPFERYDQFVSLLAEYPKMLETIQIDECPCSIFSDLPDDSYKVEEELDDGKGIAEASCYWPTYHASVKEVLHSGTYRKMPMGQLVEDPNKTRQGTSQASQNLLLDHGDIIDKTNQRAKDVVEFLHGGLSKDVYTAEEKVLIDNVRALVDLKSRMKAVQNFGAVHVASIKWKRFVQACKYFEPDFVMRMHMDDLRLQFREFYRRLEDMSQERGSTELTSLDILGRFFSSKTGLSKDVEGVLSFLAQAAVSTSVESILESWVSVIEHHSPSTRVLSDDRLQYESNVAINGPDVVHADSIIKEAMRDYWSKSKRRGDQDGHFIRRDSNIKERIQLSVLLGIYFFSFLDQIQSS